MAEKSWRFQSEDWETISLQDCRISDIEQTEDRLVLFFAESFDVERDSSLNPTGRHRNTGPAAVILEGGHFLEGAFGRNVVASVRSTDGTFRDVPLQEHPMDENTFLHKLELEVMAYQWDRENGRFTLDCDNLTNEGPWPRICCQIVLACDWAVFCWNDLPRDAWFQRTGKK